MRPRNRRGHTELGSAARPSGCAAFVQTHRNRCQRLDHRLAPLPLFLRLILTRRTRFGNLRNSTGTRTKALSPSPQPKEPVLSLSQQGTPGMLSYTPIPSQGSSPASQPFPSATCSNLPPKMTQREDQEEPGRDML